jgi:hypothetical protein
MKIVAWSDPQGAREDSPPPLTYRLDLLRLVGFAEVDLLYKNACFAAFGEKKGPLLTLPLILLSNPAKFLQHK